MDIRNYLLHQTKKALHGNPRVVVIHSSFADLLPPKSFNKWDAVFLIKSLVLDGWTVALPSFTFNYTKTGKFSVNNSPSETGLLSTWIFDLIPEAIRTTNPIYSFVLLGDMAESIMDCDSTSTWSDDSPFGLFENQNARLLMLGSGWNSCTQIHRYEEIYQVPYRYFKIFEGMAVSPTGISKKTQTKMYVRNLDVNPQLDLDLIKEKLENSDSFKKIELFRSSVLGIDVNDFASIVSVELKNNKFCLLKNSLIVENKLNIFDEKNRNPSIKIAVLGNTNSKIIEKSLLSNLLKYLPERKYEFFDLPFGQLNKFVIDKDSSLNKFNSDFRIFINRLEDLGSFKDIDSLINSTELYAASIKKLHRNHGGLTIVHDLFIGEVGHNHQTELENSQICYELNSIIRNKLSNEKNIVWLDVRKLAFSEINVYDSRLWYVGKYPFSESFSNSLSLSYTSYLIAYLGMSTRLIVLDLDNTLWGGVLGEDGVENLSLGGDYPGNTFYEFQKFLLELNSKGVALALSSKNDEDLALKAISRLPFMVLKVDNFSSYKINWQPKWKNITEIAKDLNLGLSSIMFIDDNKVEREQVRQYLPEVKIIELPKDPANYLETLKSSPYIKSIQLTKEDKKRIQSFKALRDFKKKSQASSNPIDYLRELGIKVFLQSLSEENSQRAVQLCNKTNQFNTTTKRYNLDNLKSIDKDAESKIIIVGVEDQYLSFENMGLIVLKKIDKDNLLIDLFLLSCRVLGRGLEQGLIAWVYNYCYNEKISKLSGQIVKTPRNMPVREIYDEFGFNKISEDEWFINVYERVKLPDYLEFYVEF